MDKIRIQSTASSMASAFLHVLADSRGCALSNKEFKIAVKFRLGLAVVPNVPAACICGACPDPQGNHWMKCKRGNEWDMRHTAISQILSAIIRSTQIPVSREVLLSILTPPPATFSPPPGRMDLVRKMATSIPF